MAQPIFILIVLMVLIYCTYDSHSIRAVFMSLNVYFYNNFFFFGKRHDFAAKNGELHSKNLAKCIIELVD
jgi:hypothetical protein